MMAGRQREFEMDAALKAALALFWQNGYGSTSLSDLTAAMGINKPSLYAAFGNKEALFMQALQLYMDHYGGPAMDELSDESRPLRERLRAYLYVNVETVTTPPLGCFMAGSTNEMTSDGMPQRATALVDTFNQQSQAALTTFWKAEQAAGRLSAEHDPAALALWLDAVSKGMANHARNGVGETDLKRMVDQMLALMVF